MKITAYGYYNYGNTHDQKEHLTLTPLRVIENRDDHDYSGNKYEFETDMELVYTVYTEKAYNTEWKEDRMRVKGAGGVDMEIYAENGIAFLVPLDRSLREDKIMLGNIKKHRI